MPQPESQPFATRPIAAVTQPDVPARALAQRASEQADRLFLAKKYAQAGRSYTALARESRLPADRKDQWAYCRMDEVAQRINSHPRSPQEWDEIEAEIQDIQRLVPKLWYGEYLRKVVAEARRGRRVSQAPTENLIVRGSAPDESPAPSQPDRSPRLSGNDSRTTATQTWQVHETTNFRIFHANPRLAEQAGEVAERVRATQGKRWGSPALKRPWDPRCDVYLYPDGRSLAQATGQPDTAPGFSTLLTDGTKITTRRTVLRADQPQWLAAVLPHEITHIVLADLFVSRRIPCWADEGMAVLAEPDTEQSLRAAELRESLEAGQTIDLAKLMTSDDEVAKNWSVYYAQSVSLTRFLVEQDSPERFIQFVRTSTSKGIEPALRDVYRIGSLADLQGRWLAYARQQLSTLKQDREDQGSESSLTQIESADRQNQ